MKKINQKFAAILIFSIQLFFTFGCTKSETKTETPATPTPSFKVYTSSSSSGPWTSSTVTIPGSDAMGLVDPSPILMPDNSILLYYLMSYVAGADPATTQPNNEWKIGVAKSTDNGLTFVHQGVAFTFAQSTTDPFPVVVGGTNIRMMVNQSQTVGSVTAADATGLAFLTTQDSGTRTAIGGVPGALKVGGTYYLYFCASGSIQYATSGDGLNFAPGAIAIPTSGGGEAYGDPSPISDGGGNYLMAYKKLPAGGASPKDDLIYMASSTNGSAWTTIGQVGSGSVPGLVKTATGKYLIFATN